MTSTAILLLIGAMCTTWVCSQAVEEDDLSPAEQLRQLLLKYRLYRETHQPGLSASRWGRDVRPQTEDDQRLRALLQAALEKYSLLQSQSQRGTGRWARGAGNDDPWEAIVRAAEEKFRKMLPHYKQGTDTGRYGE